MIERARGNGRSICLTLNTTSRGSGFAILTNLNDKAILESAPAPSQPPPQQN